jgi:hypothetical protein
MKGTKFFIISSDSPVAFFYLPQKKGKERFVRNGGVKTIIIQTSIVSAIQISPFLYFWSWVYISLALPDTDFL